MPDHPKLLDLFCGAGGCAKGYQRAGFYVVGVDISPQPNYCGEEFHLADALAFPLDGFDVIHASPPCQSYSALSGLTTRVYPALIEEVRERLQAAGVPYVIENVVGAPLRDPVRLCGSAFGLRVWRHRLFEMSHAPALVPPCSHHHHPLPVDVTGTGGLSSKPRSKPGGGLSRKPRNLGEAREALGIDWMTRRELAESVPPAFTEYLGEHLIQHAPLRAVHSA
jgi:DNA (cytosine-5)-methyltransferase 1